MQENLPTICNAGKPTCNAGKPEQPRVCKDNTLESFVSSPFAMQVNQPAMLVNLNDLEFMKTAHWKALYLLSHGYFLTC